MLVPAPHPPRFVVDYSHEMSLLQNAKARVKALDSELKSLKWEHEVLEQRFAQVGQLFCLPLVILVCVYLPQTEKERDELYSRFVTAIHDVQQKSGFKNLLLEKKLSALADTLEKKVCKQTFPRSTNIQYSNRKHNSTRSCQLPIWTPQLLRWLQEN